MRNIVKTFFLLLLGIFVTSEDSFSQERTRQIGERFGGEDVQYEVGFWIFPAVGKGLAHFSDLGNEKFLLTHEGQAQGLAGWLTSYRKEVHRAWMGAIAQGTRFIPLRFEEESIIGDWVRKKTTLYDYSAGKIFMETKKEGEINREVVEIPEGVYYENPITAFYNFRYGAYGKIEPGREFKIRTVPGKGKGIFRLSVASEKEAALHRESDPQKKGKDFLVRIHLEQEFLGSPLGEIEVWFDKELNPVSGMIKKVRFFGDIKGRITQLEYRSTNEAPKPF
jgi:hypothetical protein